MTAVIPRRISPAAFGKALDAFRAIVGPPGVLDSDEDRQTYIDPYALGDGLDHDCSAIVAPASTEEVRAIMRVANEFKVPLWPVSRGKNLGYGAASPAEYGNVILDLSRMNRIIEVDVKQAHCLIEPGVSYFDLYRHLTEKKIPLWMSTPGNSWGSVVGNALDRGIGYTPYGDHCEQICGMEVVLPDGDLVRTGMGAMSGSAGWQNYKYGYGPGWDQMFFQSNFGVVTKAGLWLQPEPEMTAKIELAFPKFDDAEWAIDLLADLRRRDVIQHNIVFGSPVRAASVLSQRAEWYDGPGAIPDSACEEMIRKLGIGWWNAKISLFGHASTVKAQVEIIRKLFEPRIGKELNFELWEQGDPPDKSARGIPTTMGLQSVNWYGGRGGHLSFAPVMPSDGKLILDYARKIKAYYEQVGQDYYASFTIGRRHVNNVSLILYDRDDAAMVTRVDQLYRHLVTEAASQGFGEYRGHISYMDVVADTFDFNDHALRRLNDKVKACLDPNNIIAPGRNGIGTRSA
ncbi:MAG: FAD-binding oxidoreductase [Alphaproteobacteria bacterium]|nr:FAD-binding oxidoreductase [Alphaproteobacteria bacterium]MBU0793548.1 FAD-binding oxidoreductase [Alphaproteobacteria bacterium]MBU0876398.1 FAD-binding oxidoreductase [Alphaproteobacteria bacterium]MBU1770945.1 FAD-binding oxidoreductase [Alphaproteobacteria bacterium]